MSEMFETQYPVVRLRLFRGPIPPLPGLLAESVDVVEDLTGLGARHIHRHPGGRRDRGWTVDDNGLDRGLS